jgi:hypothetical protein
MLGIGNDVVTSIIILQRTGVGVNACVGGACCLLVANRAIELVVSASFWAVVLSCSIGSTLGWFLVRFLVETIVPLTPATGAIVS